MGLKIYISSTFHGLEQYRAKAQEVFVFLQNYFDLVRIMEYMMPGSNQPPLQNCIADVNSCDIYMLIIGRQYGAIAPGTNLSYTECEYNFAKVNNKIIIPLIADTLAEGLGNVPVDDPVKFQAFVTKVTNSHPVFINKFKNPDHMATQLIQALYPFYNPNTSLEINE